MSAVWVVIIAVDLLINLWIIRSMVRCGRRLDRLSSPRKGASSQVRGKFTQGD